MSKSFLSSEPIRSFLNISFPTNNTDFELVHEFLSSVMQCNLNNITAGMRLNYPDSLDTDYEYSDGLFRSLMCKRADIHFIKIVTLRIEQISKYMQDPELQVYIIHLLRDPRGILNSVRTIQTEPFLHTSHYYCENMRRDLKSSKQLRNKFPNR